MIAPEKIVQRKKNIKKAKKVFLSVLDNDHNVRGKNYSRFDKNNHFEFEIPAIVDAFLYSPLVHQPIPELHEGTLAYDDFWDEQDRRCLEGYTPLDANGKEMPRITGAHYFYLNMVQIMMVKQTKGKKKKKLNHPYYRVLDHMLFLEIEKAELNGYGLIIGKARRMGLSYIGDCMTLWHLLFALDTETAIGAGKEDKAKDLFKKVIKSLDNLRPEYKVSYHKNATELKLTYKDTENKVQKDSGIGSMLTVKTFFSDPSAFEGGSYSFFIFEEIGLQDNLIKSYKATEPCFGEGADQIGIPMMYGTGGEVDKGSRDMKIIYDDPEAYNMKKLFIPAYLYYPGNLSKKDKQSEMDQMDNDVNFFDVRTGRTDEIKALEHILKRRKRASKSKDGYIKEIQSRPTEEAHLFLKTSGGLLNRIYLNNQLQKLFDDTQKLKPRTGRLEWVYPKELEFKLLRCTTQKERDKIHILNGSKVEFIEDEDGTVHTLLPPINTEGMAYDADIGGADSYDEEVPENTGSMGVTVIYRCFNGMSNEYNLPVAYIQERGDASSDDTYYGNSLKLAVLYRTKILVEYSKINILNYFIDCMAERYLTPKPVLANETIANKGRQKYGVHMKKEMKAIGTKLLKQEVNLNYRNYWFEKIILDLIDYGDVNTDIAMALMMCLITKLDMFDDITDDIEEYDEGDVLMDMAFYDVDAEGEMVVHSYGEQNNQEVLQMETFDPRKHLEGEDRENYLNFEKIKQHRLAEEKRRQDDMITEKSEDPFISQIKEHISKQKR